MTEYLGTGIGISASEFFTGELWVVLGGSLGEG